MSKLFEVLAKIRVRPGMYIGRASVSDLFHFLVGFKTALREISAIALGDFAKNINLNRSQREAIAGEVSYWQRL